MLAADPCMVGLGPAWGFLTRDPPPGITAPKPTISHKPEAQQRLLSQPQYKRRPSPCLQARPRSFRGSEGWVWGGGLWRALNPVCLPPPFQQPRAAWASTPCWARAKQTAHQTIPWLICPNYPSTWSQYSPFSPLLSPGGFLASYCTPNPSVPD